MHRIIYWFEWNMANVIFLHFFNTKIAQRWLTRSCVLGQFRDFFIISNWRGKRRSSCLILQEFVEECSNPVFLKKYPITQNKNWTGQRPDFFLWFFSILVSNYCTSFLGRFSVFRLTDSLVLSTLSFKVSKGSFINKSKVPLLAAFWPLSF